MIKNCKKFGWVAAMTLGAFSMTVNASTNNALNSMPMSANPIMAAPDGEGDGEEAITWIDVTLESAGSLGVEVMYKLGADGELKDVDYLKVRGTLNSADWTSLKNMSQLKGLDLREASFEAIPEEEFSGRTSLTLVYLPEGMKNIGKSAFNNTRLVTIDIPASVISIGNSAFYQVNTLSEVNFATGSVLQTIGNSAFRQCTALVKFLMPNTVTSLGTSSFEDCSALNNLSLSSALTTIPESCFEKTSSLNNVAFPENLKSISAYAFLRSGLENAILPIGLTYIGMYSFGECYSLKYLELPSFATYSSYPFNLCTALETVVCHSCTPPIISSQPPFYSVDRSKITLKVPSFAVVDYKLDTYWLNFGTIEAMDTDPTTWSLYSKLALTNNRRPNSTPAVELQKGGSLIVGGNEPFGVETLSFVEDLTNSSYGQLVNRSSVTVSGQVKTNYYVKNGTWYFLCPFTDVNLSDITHGADASYVFRYYDSENRAANGTANNASWKNVTENVLQAGRGYIFQCNKEGWLELPATADSKAKAVVSTDVTTELVAYTSENAANANWNYIGNPYPCYYDIYYMDFTAPITVRDGNNYKAYSIVDDNFVLAPMQAFFVQKPDEVNGILFKEAGRQIESTVNRASSRLLSANTDRNIYNFLLSDGVNSDETRTIINEKASLDYELTCDAAKFLSSDATMPQLYTIDSDDNLLAFNERPIDNGKVRLGFYAGIVGTYTLNLKDIGNDVQLFDAQTNNTVNLPYQFEVYTAGTYNNRFTLIFSKNDITDVQEAQLAQTSVTVVAGGVEVTAKAGTDITLYRTDGTLYCAIKAKTGSNTISLPAGLYIVKVGNKSFKSFVY